MMGSKAFESPLISHARMRGMFRALVETRVLGAHAGKRLGLPKNLEAAWVATALDLKSGDLVSSAQHLALIDHIRVLGERDAAKGATVADVKKSLLALEAVKAKSRSATTMLPIDRLMAAVGSAMALYAADEKAVAIAYIGQGELTAAEWKRVFTITEQGGLPLVIVTVPDAKTALDIAAIGHRLQARTVPVIPVDAGDVVAIYRVAQESIVRARADARVAIIECVSCGSDPIKVMGAQLVKKKICTERWVAEIEPAFRKLLQP